MCKFVRKIATVGVVVAGGLLVLSWAGLSSYPATAFKNFRQSLKKQVPLEFEIERLRHQVSQLVPDMKKNLSTMAEQMVAVKNLRDEVTITRAKLADQKDSILAMTRDVESGTATISYHGHDYSRSRIRDKLARDFKSYQMAEEGVKSKEKLLEAREKELDASREQLAELKNEKQELEVALARMEAELKTLRLAQSRSKFQFDNSRLSQCKATLAEIRNRLQVEKTAADLEGDFANDAIKVEKKTETSVTDQVQEIKGYFGEGTRDDGKVAEKK
jgi:chromosome segregation ATPase